MTELRAPELRACVIGHPIGHSRSPLIHKYWLAVHGISGDYTRVDVPPEDIERFFDEFPQSGLVGGNVTIPHKEIAFRKVVEADPVARVLGAVNTIWVKDGKLPGASTDVHGFIANLNRSQPGWDGRTKTAVMIGAGGASRAIAYGLLEKKVQNVIVANRTFERAKEVSAHFDNRLVPVALSNVAPHLREADLVINATSLGMTGQPPLDLDLSPLKKSAIVYDVVYAPLETELLKAAKARGNPVVDGLGMLVHQAAPAFERWFGVRPEVTPELRALVAADLAREAKR
jgi:shikimate dehydrogenase